MVRPSGLMWVLIRTTAAASSSIQAFCAAAVETLSSTAALATSSDRIEHATTEARHRVLRMSAPRDCPAPADQRIASAACSSASDGTLAAAAEPQESRVFSQRIAPCFSPFDPGRAEPRRLRWRAWCDCRPRRTPRAESDVAREGAPDRPRSSAPALPESSVTTSWKRCRPIGSGLSAVKSDLVRRAPRVGLEIVEVGTGRKLAVPLRDDEAVQLRLLVRRGRHRAAQVRGVDRPAAAGGFGDPLDLTALLRGLVAFRRHGDDRLLVAAEIGARRPRSQEAVRDAEVPHGIRKRGARQECRGDSDEDANGRMTLA